MQAFLRTEICPYLVPSIYTQMAISPLKTLLFKNSGKSEDLGKC